MGQNDSSKCMFMYLCIKKTEEESLKYNFTRAKKVGMDLWHKNVALAASLYGMLLSLWSKSMIKSEFYN